MNVVQWIQFFQNSKNSKAFLQKDYGDNYARLDQKRQDILRILNLHVQKFGQEDIILIRSPRKN